MPCLPLVANIDVNIRSNSTVNLAKGSKTTNTPYGYFVSDFGKSSIKGFDKIDLSAYPNKHLLVGYGVYDINQENCRYLDVPSNSNFDIDFNNRTVIGDNTFGISRNKYTYSECLSKVAQYSGFVFTPKDASQYAIVNNRLKLQDKDTWIGYTRKNCTAPYLNDEHFEQSYEDFLHKNEVCTAMRRFTVKPKETSVWMRRDSSETHYCPIKIASPDYLRPIKFCMPWWRVERQWHLSDNDDTVEYNGKMYDFKYMQYIIDYPIDKTICIQKKVIANNPYYGFITNPKTYEETCESYSYYKESPACAMDISLPICQINECKGTVMDTCRKKTSFSPAPKDYKLGFVIKDGVRTKIKVKDKITVHVYDCPIPSVSASTCLKKARVSVFPAECGNNCSKFTDCLRDSNTTAKKCLKDFPCEKNYGSVDNIQFDSEGIATALKGMCKDGITEVTAPIEIKSVKKEVCEEFNLIKKTTVRQKTCISESISSKKTVSTAITEKDSYSNNKRCIRINNLEESRPSINTVFQYETYGFYNIDIVKAQIDGNETRTDTNSSSLFMQYNSQLTLKPFGKDFSRTVNSTKMEEMLAKCETILPQANMTKRADLLANSFPTSQPDIKGFLRTNTAPNVDKCPSGYTLKNQRCEKTACTGTYKVGSDSCQRGTFSCAYPAKRTGNTCIQSSFYSYPIIAVSSAQEASFSSIPSSTGLQAIKKNVKYDDYDFASLGIANSSDLEKLSIFGGDFIVGDIFSSVADDTSSDIVEAVTKDSKTSEECDLIAKCASGKVISNSSNCHIEIGGLPAQKEDPTTVAKYVPPSLSTLPHGSGTLVSNFNGYSDIYSIQEYTEGDFGYYTNYSSAFPKNNVVKVKNREVFPIINNRSVPSILNYNYSVQATTQMTKHRSPDSYNGYNRGYSLEPRAGAQSVLTQLLLGNDTADGIATNIGDNNGVAAVLGLATLGVSEIVMMFGQKMRYGWYKSHHTISKNIPARYVANVYNYDTRAIFQDKFIYDKKEIFTGTLKKGDFLIMRDNIKKEKKSSLELEGYSSGDITKMTSSSAEKWNPSWSMNIHWWQGRAKKTTNKSSSGNIDITKKLNTVYMGATNTVSIIVPYSGDYEVTAYDKFDNVLATTNILKENFISGTSDNGNATEYYAKVQFAKADNFNISIGQNKKNLSGSCLSSDYVEWGGGVSGIYYEENVPDLGSICNKSTDEYVLAHSAVKLTVRALNSPVSFKIKLKKPMPFANRVILVNFMNLEDRKYECFTSIKPCTISSTSTKTSENK